jgi:hypothetical protein
MAVGGAGFAGQLLGALVVQRLLAGGAAHVQLEITPAQAVLMHTVATHQKKARTVAGARRLDRRL